MPVLIQEYPTYFLDFNILIILLVIFIVAVFISLKKINLRKIMLSIVVIDILLTMVYICCGVYGYYQLPETAYKVLVYNMDIKKVLYIIGILILFVGVDLLKKVIDRFKGGK